MKRAGLLLFSVAAAMFFAPLNLSVSNSHLPAISRLSAEADAVVDGKPVCVALPVYPGPQGSCKKGEVEIPNDPGSGGAVIFYLKWVLKLVNTLVGGIIVLMLVIAGIQYITSGGDPGNVKSAKTRVQNSVIALLLYLMMFAILNFLIPGGVL